MIGWENYLRAATSFPKPVTVCRQMNEVMRRIGANPGRSDHKLARKANQIITETREKIAELLVIPQAQRVIFTCNATEAINLGLKGHPNLRSLKKNLERKTKLIVLPGAWDLGYLRPRYNSGQSGVFESSRRYGSACEGNS